MKDNITLLAEKLRDGEPNIVFTGAGISTESGIPDYRSKGGIWEQFRPVYFDEFMNSKDARIEYWRRKSELYQELAQAQPNPAHKALATLYEMGLLEAVVTQNIDGLHQKAGLPDDRVIELHGNTMRVRCMSCDCIFSIHEAQQRIEAGDLAPECKCGGFLKPDTISFGQQMPELEMRKAFLLSQRCRIFLVIGSTLLVHPAATLPKIAQQHGAFLGIMNLSETPYDDDADVLIRRKAGEAMTELVKQLQELQE